MSPASLSRVGETGQESVTSPEAGRGRPVPAGGSRAGEGWMTASGNVSRIRPSASFSRVGEKGQTSVAFAFSPFPRAVNDSAGQRAGMIALAKDLLAVDEDVPDAGRELMWLSIRRVICYLVRIKDDDVREIVLP